MTQRPPENLGQLRAELDRIDALMQELLIERSTVTDRVELVKRAAGTIGSAFRPGREAEIMRMLATRHRGSFPLDTTENVWRVIIATSTYVQSKFSIYGDISGGDAPLRDSVRFHFGFTVPFLPMADAGDVIEAVDGSTGDLGVFPIEQRFESGAWWRKLHGASRPKIIARLPFINRPNHPSGIPVFCIAKPLKEAAVREEIIGSLWLERWHQQVPALLEKVGARIEASAGIENGLALMVTHPGDIAEKDLRAALTSASIPSRYEEIGSHATAYTLPSDR